MTDEPDLIQLVTRGGQKIDIIAQRLECHELRLFFISFAPFG